MILYAEYNLIRARYNKGEKMDEGDIRIVICIIDELMMLNQQVADDLKNVMDCLADEKEKTKFYRSVTSPKISK